MTVAVVLAAGVGRRLREVSDLPKWLVPVGATCPADVQIDALARTELREVVVVVGPRPDAIADLVERRRGDLAVRLVGNDLHDRRNNWYSLQLGLEAIAPDDDVLVCNSDLFASPAWLAESMARLLGSDAPAALAVDDQQVPGEEAMKVAVDAERQITRIGKIGVVDPAGEYVGLSWWSATSAAELLAVLQRFAGDDAKVDHWYEHGIDEHLDAGGRYAAVPVPSSAWVEIDDPRDLERAATLLDPAK